MNSKHPSSQEIENGRRRRDCATLKSVEIRVKKASAKDDLLFPEYMKRAMSVMIPERIGVFGAPTITKSQVALYAKDEHNDVHVVYLSGDTLCLVANIIAAMATGEEDFE